MFKDDASSVNVWDYKPWWCQPPSIIATGTALTLFVYSISHGSLLFTGIIGFFVSVWWYIFLIVYPVQYAAYLNELEESEQPFDS